MKYEVPKSLEAEETLLGNMILYPDSLKLAIYEQVTIDDFFLDKHRTIFQVISSMYENKEKVDIISLSQKMKDLELLDKIGGMQCLLNLADSTISAVNTKSYINILKNKAISRKLIKIGEDIKDNTYDSGVMEDVQLIIAKHRNGPTGIIDLKFEPKCTKFYGISHAKDNN